MLLAIALGVGLAVVTIAIYAVGSTVLIRVLRHHAAAFESRWGEMRALMFTAFCLLSLHIVETVLWAMTCAFIVSGDQFASLDDAAYFSTVTFTTLGYGDIVIEGQWRMLSACQAMTGLLVFGWSAALLFAVVERVWKRRFDEG